MQKRCIQCGSTYEPRPQSDGHGVYLSRYLDSRFCSRDCFHEARRQDAASRKLTDTRICQQCGKGYGRNGRKPGEFAKSKYCSLECCGRSQQNNLAAVLQRIVINPETGCHIWPGEKTHNGYGRVKFDGRNQVVHRVVWEQSKGPVPPGLQIDHICCVKACCNIAHLRVVTAKENSKARNYRRNENCPKCGGPYSVWAKSGNRYCRPCRTAKMTAYTRQWRANKQQELEQKE